MMMSFDFGVTLGLVSRCAEHYIPVLTYCYLDVLRICNTQQHIDVRRMQHLCTVVLCMTYAGMECSVKRLDHFDIGRR